MDWRLPHAKDRSRWTGDLEVKLNWCAPEIRSTERSKPDEFRQHTLQSKTINDFFAAFNTKN